MTWLLSLFLKGSLGLAGSLGGLAMRGGIILAGIAMIFLAGIRFTHNQIKIHSVEIKEDQIAGDAELRERHGIEIEKKDRIIDELKRQAEAARRAANKTPGAAADQAGGALLTPDDIARLKRLRE